jgi:hypothetical protein
LLFAGRFLPNPRANRPSDQVPNAQRAVIPGSLALAFTLAPHLQTINHRGCFSAFAGI